jgi:general L-amino acid transport system ATP-binding protein
MISLADDGMTMICVTHEMGFARQVADRIIFMDQGMMISNSSPSEFFDVGDNPRIKQFLGDLLH